MSEKDLEMCAGYFLEHQRQLFDKPVAGTPEEAADFLEECFAQVLDDIESVRDYLEDIGMDTDGMKDEEIESQMEVFKLPDGRYLVVAG